MSKEVPKYIIEKMKRIEKYRDEIVLLTGDITDWLYENGIDGINDNEVASELYELRYGCGSAYSLVGIIIEKFKENQ
ncbi:MAG: hypothetical protein ACOCQR_02175 [bacterium]